MNSNSTISRGARPVVQVRHEPPNGELTWARFEHRHENGVMPTAGVNTLKLGHAGECDFNALLTGILARFTNCPAQQVERELGTAFNELCEFLECEGAGLWRPSGQDPDSFTLMQVYRRSVAAKRGPVEVGPDSVGREVEGASQSFSLLPGAESKAHFPWLTAQARRGKSVSFLSLAELPAEAACDKMELARLGAHSSTLSPLVVQGKVVGAATFELKRDRASWPDALAGRLKFASQVLGIAMERAAFEEALAKSCAEIKQLKEQLLAERDYLRTEFKVSQAHGQIIGGTQSLKRVLHQVEQVAPTECPVLISGETGTGKELIAQEIHRLSVRKERVMVLVNCAALPAALVESELFGRERGAYTGALTAQVGRFELANGSTIFLDEVGELSMEVQAKLLRVLQGGEFQRLGSPKTHKVDVRIITATNRDLAGDVRKGRFREDLYYRLKVFPIEIPPLRERVGDIPSLTFAFMEEFSARMGKKITKVPRKAMEVLQRHTWPGNIRELRNVIEHSVILTSGEMLKLSSLGDSPTRDGQAVTLAEAEREHILKTLESTGWRIKGPHGAAHRLDLQPSTLYSRMQKLGIPHRRQKDEMATRG